MPALLLSLPHQAARPEAQPADGTTTGDPDGV